MFENLVIGPLCIVTKDYTQEMHIKALYLEGWTPTCVLSSGEIFDEVVKTQYDAEKIILSVGYNKIYE